MGDNKTKPSEIEKAYMRGSRFAARSIIQHASGFLPKVVLPKHETPYEVFVCAVCRQDYIGLKDQKICSHCGHPKQNKSLGIH